MSEQLKIKVCGMRHAENIAEVLELPIDFIGFIFYPRSPRFVEGTLVWPRLDGKSNTVKSVGVFVNSELTEAIYLLQKYSLDYAQLHGNESAQYCLAIKEAGYGVIKVFSVDDTTDFFETEQFEGIADLFLFDTKSPQHGGTGKKFNWEVLERYHGHTQVLLSGGLEPEDIPAIKTLVRNYPWIKGLDLNSRFEITPGLKDKEKLRTFISSMHTS